MSHAFDPVSASKKIGIISKPIGTLAEIKAAGYDPTRTACCHKHGNGVYGCGAEERCPFTEEGVGGYTGSGSTNFKLEGPRMLGVQTRTARGEGEKRFQRQQPCYDFTRIMLSRMQHGQAQAVLRKDHELIEIVSVEGDGFEMWQTKFVPVDAVGYANGTNRRETPVEESFTVMRFPRPGETGMGREQNIEERLRQQEIERAKKKRAYFETEAREERAHFRELHARQADEERKTADAAAAMEPAVPVQLEDLQAPGEAEQEMLEKTAAGEVPAGEPLMRPSRRKV